MKKYILLSLLLILWMPVPALSEPMIIVHKEVSISTISLDLIKKIYLGKSTQWDDGRMVVPLVLQEGPLQDWFLKDIVKKSESQYSIYWKKMVFIGQGVPPKSVSSDAEMVRAVSHTPGGIGYIDSATPHEGVRGVSMK